MLKTGQFKGPGSPEKSIGARQGNNSVGTNYLEAPASTSNTSKDSSGASSRAPASDHWICHVVETVITTPSEGSVTVLGGSDNGEFPYLGEIKKDTKYPGDGPSLVCGSLILEVQGQRVAGYTQRDVVAWLNHCTRNGNPCVIKTAPQVWKSKASGEITQQF
ncbi:uncharacterized protein LOC143032257 [Oratosquilla oratoria]|uniref:uncharacterized protein LOC143032257 n=1 Tax=Oratosquilla oratoria TaxID=337810 RepID=UPI003F764BFD